MLTRQRNHRRMTLVLAGIAGLVLPSAFASAQNVERFEVFDLNGDGRTDSADFQAWEQLAQAGDMRADLNGDGRIDARDRSLAERSTIQARDARPFVYHWSVTGEEHHGLVDVGNAPIARDTAFFSQHRFGKYPRNGYHEMFVDSNGSHARWRQNYEAWMAEHLDKVRSDLLERRQTHPDFQYVVLDFEAAMPIWAQIEGASTNTFARDWRAFIAALHRDRLNPEFMSLVGFVPPAGAVRWSDLNAHQRVELCAISWNYFGKDIYARTFERCRATVPNVKWGIFNIPKFNMSVPVRAPRQRLNDEYGWLLEMVDYFAASLYRAPFVWGGTAPCPQQTHEDLLSWYQGNYAEFDRLRQRFNPNAEILGFVFTHYHPGTCAGRAMPAATLSDANLRAQLMYPRFFGADGILMWHPLRREPHPDKPWLRPDAFAQEISGRWAPYMIDASQGYRGVSVNGGNEAPDSSIVERNRSLNTKSGRQTAGVTVFGGQD